MEKGLRYIDAYGGYLKYFMLKDRRGYTQNPVHTGISDQSIENLVSFWLGEEDSLKKAALFAQKLLHTLRKKGRVLHNSLEYSDWFEQNLALQNLTESLSDFFSALSDFHHKTLDRWAELKIIALFSASQPQFYFFDAYYKIDNAFFQEQINLQMLRFYLEKHKDEKRLLKPVECAIMKKAALEKQAQQNHHYALLKSVYLFLETHYMPTSFRESILWSWKIPFRKESVIEGVSTIVEKPIFLRVPEELDAQAIQKRFREGDNRSIHTIPQKEDQGYEALRQIAVRNMEKDQSALQEWEKNALEGFRAWIQKQAQVPKKITELFPNISPEERALLWANAANLSALLVS
eukprot:g8542.t1